MSDTARSGKDSFEPYTQYPPPPNHPDFYDQYRKEDAVANSLYDINFKQNPSRLYKNKGVLVIDSRDRSSGSICDYTYILDDLFYDVISVELKMADIPNSTYIVNPNNNQFYFQDTQDQVDQGKFHRVTMPLGNYLANDPILNTDSIRSLLEQGMNEASQGSQYTVTVNPNQNKFTIEQTAGSGFFNIFFENPNLEKNKCPIGNLIDNTMEDLLGFTKGNYFDEASYTSDLVFNLKREKCVVLRIESDGYPWRRITSSNNYLKDAFALFPFDFRLNNFQFLANLDNINNEIYVVDFKEPRKMGRFHIRLQDCQGRPIDFNGQDHLLTFEVTSLSRFDNYHE